MNRACAVLALGLLTAAVGRAGEKGQPAPREGDRAPHSVPNGRAHENGPLGPPAGPPAGAPHHVAHPEAVPPAGCGAPCATPCATRPCRPSCLQRLLGWLTYRPLRVPACCKTCCNRVPYCQPEPYLFFLYGPGTCGGGQCRRGCPVNTCHGNGCAQQGCHTNGHAPSPPPPVPAPAPPHAPAPVSAAHDSAAPCASCPTCGQTCGRRPLLGSWRPGQLLGVGR